VITKLDIKQQIPLIGDLRVDARINVSQDIWDTSVAYMFRPTEYMKTVMRSHEQYIENTYRPSSLKIDSISLSSGI